jgi:hypothetical protein
MVSAFPETGTDGGLVVRFELERDGARAPLSLPLDMDEGIEVGVEASTREAALLELLDAGLARHDASRAGYVIGFDEIDSLDHDQISQLGLEVAQGWRMNLDLQGVIGRSNLQLRTRWVDPDGSYDATGADGDYVEVSCGLVDTRRGRLVLLPPELTRIREMAREISGPGMDNPSRFERLAYIQRALEAYDDEYAAQGFEEPVDVRVDGQIREERFIAPDRVGVELRPSNDGGLELRPTIEGFESFDDAAGLLEIDESRREFFSRDRETGQRVRVALPERTHRELSRVRRRRHVPKEDVAEFVRDPRRYLQPPEELTEDELGTGEEVEELDTLDLSALPGLFEQYELESFGDRVIAIEQGVVGKSIARETPFGLGEGWFGPKVEVDPDEALIAQAIHASTAEPEPVMGSAPVALQTAENTDELTYEEQRAAALDRRFEELELPSCLSATLYDYQEQGHAWLRNLSDSPAARVGGLLADDMGLGKTIQVISLLCHLHENRSLMPSLFVVPKSVIPNWTREIRKFCSARLAVVEHVGPGRSRDPVILSRADVILTTYDTMSRDQLVLGQLELSVLALDEAQYIKNYTTRRASAARAMNARLKLALTATPVENNLDELWSIMDFAQPGLLGTLADFRMHFAGPLEAAASEAREQRAVAEHLLGTIEEHYLRRTKAEVLAGKLPAKHLHRVPLRMTTSQVSVYERVREHYTKIAKGALPAIRAMLDVCAHPFAGSERVLRAIGKPHDLTEICTDPSFVERSAKFTWLVTKLEEIEAAGEKVILFSSFRKVQVMLRELVRQRYGFAPPVINGDVAAGQRQEIIDRFNGRPGFGVIVMSALAAGVGVNVTGANHVVHMTREWNPAKENQATDRAYRIGQQRPVHVYVPVVSHPEFASLDIRLDELLSSKQHLATQVIRPSGELSVQWKELEACLKR